MDTAILFPACVSVDFLCANTPAELELAQSYLKRHQAVQYGYILRHHTHFTEVILHDHCELLQTNPIQESKLSYRQISGILANFYQNNDFYLSSVI